MTKDPAFLFYPGDWLGGTMGMSFEAKGAYIELLILQFNNHHFTEAQAKQVLSICSTSAQQMVMQKFIKEGEFYYNPRLRSEIEKRKAFSESRRINALQRKKKEKDPEAYTEHMENENENENNNKLFDLFWLNYPKKVGKGAALKAWKKIKNKSDVIEKMKIILPQQIESDQWKKENGQYIPNPATYLNQRRWEDEVYVSP